MREGRPVGNPAEHALTGAGRAVTEVMGDGAALRGPPNEKGPCPVERTHRTRTLAPT